MKVSNCWHSFLRLYIYTFVGDIETAYFMSDCAEQYYNAWSGVYSADNTKRLLCI